MTMQGTFSTVAALLLGGCFSEAPLILSDEHADPDLGSTSLSEGLESSSNGGEDGHGASATGGSTSSGSSSSGDDSLDLRGSSSDASTSSTSSTSSTESGGMPPAAFGPCMDGQCDGGMACMSTTEQAACGPQQECRTCTFFCAGEADDSCPDGSFCHATRLYCVLPCGACGDGEVCVEDDPEFCSWPA